MVFSFLICVSWVGVGRELWGELIGLLGNLLCGIFGMLSLSDGLKIFCSVEFSVYD